MDLVQLSSKAELATDLRGPRCHLLLLFCVRRRDVGAHVLTCTWCCSSVIIVVYLSRLCSVKVILIPALASACSSIKLRC